MQAFLFRRLKIFKHQFSKGKTTIKWFVEEILSELIILRFLIKYNFVERDFLDTE
ncbi:hypothetical protein [Clostridium sp.]|uniref:hypothetical protein n=1 Tax=Clostridium sp. TaxID=1506 RepID=UPI003D6D97FE